MELNKAVNALNSAGVPSTLSFAGVGEGGQLLVSLLSGTGNKVVGGEAIIRMDNWCAYSTPLWTTNLREGLQAYLVVYLCFALDLDSSPISSHPNNLFFASIIAAVKGRNREVLAAQILCYGSGFVSFCGGSLVY
jgi:hypothetical protein